MPSLINRLCRSLKDVKTSFKLVQFELAFIKKNLSDGSPGGNVSACTCIL